MKHREQACIWGNPPEGFFPLGPIVGLHTGPHSTLAVMVIALAHVLGDWVQQVFA